MRLSKNWLNEWIDLSAKSAEDICAALNEIGLEVDSCERIRVPSKVVVAKVQRVTTIGSMRRMMHRRSSTLPTA